MRCFGDLELERFDFEAAEFDLEEEALVAFLFLTLV